MSDVINSNDVGSSDGFDVNEDFTFKKWGYERPHDNHDKSI